MLSWFLAESADVASARDRRIIAWAGLAPDVDALAYAGAIVWYGFNKDLAYENVWRVVHHRYTHGVTFVVLTGVAAWWLAARTPARGRVALLALLASAIHNFCDVVAGGPTWPIYPLWPLSDFGWTASWSWPIGEWPNVAVLFGCLAATLLYARVMGRSPMECFGDRANAWFVRVTRQERPKDAGASAGRLRWLIWIAVVLATIAILAPLGFNPFG
jgi:hypothetical protein